MRILITGGCGFVGCNLAREAIARGHDVTVLDSLARHGAAANLAWLRRLGGFRFVHGDVRVASDVDRVVGEVLPDVVFHLAGQVAMTTSVQNPRYDFEVNVGGSFAVLDAVRRLAPGAIVLYSSTNKVYGDLEELRYDERATRWIAPDFPRGFAESLPFAPATPYGVSKGAADSYMQDFFRMFGVRTVVFRHSSMYGGRQFATYDQGWIGWFCQKAIEQAAGAGEPFTVSGDGKQVRDVLHADDVVALYFAAVEHADRAAGQVFNVGGGMDASLSLLELLAELGSIVGTPLRFTHIAQRKSDQKVFVADVAKAERLLGWRPRVAVRAGLERMVAALREQGAEG